MSKFIILLLTLLFAVSFFTSCKNEEETVKKEKPKIYNSETTISATGSALTVCGAWIRPAAKDRNSALYFNVINSSRLSDTLLSAESDLAKVVEIHETYERGEGMMGMRHVEFVEIAANDTMSFKPKSYHIMLIGLNDNLTIGDTGKVSLNFATAGQIQLTAPIQDTPTKSCCEE